MGIFKKAISGIGSLVNDITGTSSSAKTQFNNQLKLQENAQNFAKWQMANAHQIEIKDLENAGLNPVLSAGGGGASANVGGGTASAGQASMNPLDMIMGLMTTAKGVEKTNADIKNETQKTQAEVNKLLKEAGYTEKQIEYYNKWGVFPGATETTSGSGTALFGLAGASGSKTKPIGLKERNTNTDEIPTSAKKIGKFIDNRIKTWKKTK